MAAPPPGEDPRGRSLLGALLAALAYPDAEAAADRLIAEFSTLARVLAASPERQRRVSGSEEVPRLFGLIRATLLHALWLEATARPVISSFDALSAYLHAALAHRASESARVLHLDARNRLLRDELLSEGSVEWTAMPVREIVRRTLELGSAAIILVHNHPSGDPQPSTADLQSTRKIIAALREIDVRVHDHIIVSARGHSSLRAMGVL